MHGACVVHAWYVLIITKVDKHKHVVDEEKVPPTKNLAAIVDWLEAHEEQSASGLRTVDAVFC